MKKNIDNKNKQLEEFKKSKTAIEIKHSFSRCKLIEINNEEEKSD